MSNGKLCNIHDCQIVREKETLLKFNMEKKHRDLIRKNRVALVADLEPLPLSNYLYQEGVLSENDLDNIRAERTRSAQAEKLLDTLPKRGPKAFDTFCCALGETDGQGHLGDLLRKTSGAATRGIIAFIFFASNQLQTRVQIT